MAIERIREAPSDLPYARLYIDDITEIQRIIGNAFDPNAGISFEYVIGKALRITTLEELLAHGGYSAQFELLLVAPESNDELQYGQTVLSFDSDSIWSWPPRFRCPSRLKGSEFDLYARVAAVLRGRAMSATNAVKLLPPTVTGLFNALPFCCFFLLFDSFWWGHYKTGVVWLCVALCGGIVSLAEMRKSGVYFSRHRQDELAKKQRRNERLEKLLWLFIGTLIGSVGTFLAQHLTGKR